MTTISKELMRHAKALAKKSWAQGDDNVLGADRKGCCIATACVAAAKEVFGDPMFVGVSRDAVLLFKYANGIDAAAAQVPGALRPRDPNKPHKKRAPKDAA